MNEKIISIEQAIEMRNEYCAHFKTSIENAKGSGYKATEFAWIDLETLKEYVQKLEEIQDSNDEIVSGVRIYFSAYPDASTFACDSRTAVPLQAKETIFMVPTIQVASTPLSKQNQNLEHLPFCINPSNDSDPYVGSFEIIKDLLHSCDNIDSRTTTNYTNKTSLLLNRFGMTPPPN